MAKLKLFRCHNSDCSTVKRGAPEFEFWAEKSTCPKCGQDEENGGVFHLEIIHFDPPSKVRSPIPRGLGVLACTGKGFGGQMATGHAGCVNCPKCKETTAWKKAFLALTGDEDGTAGDVAFMEEPGTPPETPPGMTGTVAAPITAASAPATAPAVTTAPTTAPITAPAAVTAPVVAPEK